MRAMFYGGPLGGNEIEVGSDPPDFYMASDLAPDDRPIQRFQGKFFNYRMGKQVTYRRAIRGAGGRIWYEYHMNRPAGINQPREGDLIKMDQVMILWNGEPCWWSRAKIETAALALLEADGDRQYASFSLRNFSERYGDNVPTRVEAGDYVIAAKRYLSLGMDRK